jgi:mono/diheme cytochrome c family protein
MSVLRIVVSIGAGVVVIAGGGLGWLWARSPDARPAPAEAVERTPERLERGEYIAIHLADCAGCHSDHVFDRFAAPLKPGTLFQGGFPFDAKLGVPGLVCAQNLTPDPETGKGRWTDGELLRAFREGVSKDGHALFPMMPFEQFRMMSDEDAKAVVAYLRTVPAIKNPIPPTQLAFPVNLLIKFKPTPIAERVVAPDDAKDHLAYGRYLVVLAGCKECHTAHDDHGARLPGRDYAGGWEMVGPWGRVVSANITPDPETWLGRASKEEFIGRFKAFQELTAQSAPVAEPGHNTVMPWLAYGGLTEPDLGAMYDYLKTQPPIRNAVVSFPDAKK